MNRARGDGTTGCRTIVVIPARGGSKRFPRKNIAPLAGRPLIAYSIAAARAALCVDDVFVSTEDTEIAQIAKSWGASVPFLRPMELADDVTTNDEVVADFIRQLEVDSGVPVDIVVLIQPTSPFVTSNHIDMAVRSLQDRPELDSVTTMTKLDHRHHPYNLARPDGQGDWDFIFADLRNQSKSRQSKPIFLKFGNLFAARKQTMLTSGRFGPTKGSVLIDELYAWDIDEPWALRLAETVLDEGLIELPHIAKMPRA